MKISLLLSILAGALFLTSRAKAASMSAEIPPPDSSVTLTEEDGTPLVYLTETRQPFVRSAAGGRETTLQPSTVYNSRGNNAADAGGGKGGGWSAIGRGIVGGIESGIGFGLGMLGIDSTGMIGGASVDGKAAADHMQNALAAMSPIGAFNTAKSLHGRVSGGGDNNAGGGTQGSGTGGSPGDGGRGSGTGGSGGAGPGGSGNGNSGGGGTSGRR